VDKQLDRSSYIEVFSTPTSHVKHVCCVTLKMSSQSKESSSTASTTVSTADHSMAIIIGNSTEDQKQ
jgi:hypothetical protein